MGWQRGSERIVTTSFKPALLVVCDEKVLACFGCMGMRNCFQGGGGGEGGGWWHAQMSAR